MAYFREATPHVKDLKICPECKGEIIQDLFQLPKDDKKQGRFIEAQACEACKIIYDVIS